MTQFQQQSQRNWGARLREVIYHGIRMVILENEHLRVAILAGKGTDIVELNFKPLDLDFVWLAPVGVRDPVQYAVTSPDSRANFRENYPGGWQEVFPNGGLPCSFEGAHYGQHGEVFNVPWDFTIVEDREDAVAVRFTVRTRKSPFILEKTIRMDAETAGFHVEERLINASPVPAPAMWGHHITFGRPFLKPGHQIRLPAGINVIPHPAEVAPGGRRVSSLEPFSWPRDPANGTDLSVIPEQGAPSDLVYLTGFRDAGAWYEVVDPVTMVGCRVEWDSRVMPYLWYWQEFGSSTGYPWYGRNFNIGLEPFSSYPSNGLAEAVENQSALWVEPNQERTFELTMRVLNPIK